MHIGYIYNLKAYPPKGGNHRHVFELIQGFLEFGHQVSVLGDNTMPGVSNYENNQEDLSKFIRNIDVLYIRIDARSVNQMPGLKVCMQQLGSKPVIWEINAPYNETLAYSWLGGGDSGEENTLRRFKRWVHALRKKPLILWEEHKRKRLAKKVSSAICVSSALGEYASSGLKIKDILVLPNGGPLISEAEINERRARRKLKNFTVFYSGSAIYPWQGLNFLSGVIGIAEKEAPDIVFILAVNQRTPDLPISDNVIILEGLNREEILDAICAADVCVALHPEYFWSKYKFHGSPMKLFEYMACMAPSLTSNLGQMSEIIQDGEDGVLCENDPQDIFNKLVYLKENQELAESIGRTGWERIQSDFNWKCNAQKTLHIFEQLSGNPK